jgi:hypothetical protein
MVADAATNGYHLHWPKGRYRLTAPIEISASNLLGFGIVGASRNGTVFYQTADNQPIFTIVSANAHSNAFSNFSATWSTAADSTKTDRCVIKWTGPTTDQTYNSTIEKLTVTNGHYVLRSDDALTWGIACRDWMLSNMSGGAWNLTGPAGEPNLRAENIYINATGMIGPLFLGNALSVQMDNIEINAATMGPVLIQDGGGGNYVIGVFGIETGTYGSSLSLIDLQSGTLQARHLYLNLTATARIFGVKVGNVGSWAQIDMIRVKPTLTGSGEFYLGSITGTLTDPEADHGWIEIRKAYPYAGKAWSASAPIIAPTWVGGDVTADALRITEWNDPARVAYRGDANVTLKLDAPMVNVFPAELTTDRVVTLPNNALMFSGRTFEVVKTITGTGKLTVKNPAGTTIGEIAAANKGRLRVVWNRSLTNGPSQNWTVIASETWS